MRAPGAVQVLRAAQAARQSRRPWPPLAQVRLHSRSCCVQVLGHAAAALPLVAASDRTTIATRTSARRCTGMTAYGGSLEVSRFGRAAGRSDGSRNRVQPNVPPPVLHVPPPVPAVLSKVTLWLSPACGPCAPYLAYVLAPPGRGLLGAKGEYPLRVPYLLEPPATGHVDGPTAPSHRSTMTRDRRPVRLVSRDRDEV